MDDKEKVYEPARHNEESPAPGMAAVNTHLPEEKPIDAVIEEQEEPEDEGLRE